MAYYLSNDPEIIFGDDGAPRSARFGDIYYSLEGGLAESQAVFLNGCDLPQAWLGKTDFCVLELGFGTGLNVLALIDLWLKNRPSDGQLRIFSIEAFLMSREKAEKALFHFPQLKKFVHELLEQWPEPRLGIDYIDFPKWEVSLTLAQMDVVGGLKAFGHRADAVFLDGFSPKLNPDMWSEEVMSLIAKRCRTGTRLATFTVAGSVRNALFKAGFSVKKCAGFGKKRERLEAIFDGPPQLSPMRIKPKKIAILGAGIAGACLYSHARDFGIDVTLFEANTPAHGASGNRAGLVSPRLDSGDNKAVRLIADSYTYALNFYRHRSDSGVLGRGVYQFANDQRDMVRFSKITHQPYYAANSFALFEIGQNADVVGREGIILKSALHIVPTEIISSLLNDAKVIKKNIVSIEGGSLVSDDGTVFSDFDEVILANGEGIFDLLKAPFLRPVHGQVEYIITKDKPTSALSWGGYCVPDKTGFAFGATHDRDVRGNQISETDRCRNLASIIEIMPERMANLEQEAIISRASTRVMSLDLMPVIGKIGPQLWTLTGLGSRGFCTAPLMAKWLTQMILRQGIDAHEDVIKSVCISRFEAKYSS